MIPAAYAVLDLAALKANLQQVRSYVPAARVMAVVKANGYGHGLIRVALALKEADGFAVARVEEGILLRKAGFKQRIAVLEGFVDGEELMAHQRFALEPVIHQTEQLHWLESVSLAGALRIWLKLDTGMHRLGIEPAEFQRFQRRLARCRHIVQPISLMTHLANADDTSDGKTIEQIERFHQVARGIETEKSIANSAGILAWRQSHADWVRPGIMLYGVSPFPERNARHYGLQPVMSVHSRLIAIKQLRRGDAVGYGGDWRCPRDGRLGIAAIGYGDGYPRHVATGAPVLVNGQRVPLVGRVSMDMIALDLSDCAKAKVGDRVTLWGEGLPVEEIARHAATIPYTLLCGITQRVRIFEADPAILHGEDLSHPLTRHYSATAE